MTFGGESYAPIPGETAGGATAIQIWREIPRDRLTLGKILGEGEFGMVVKGELTEDDGHVTPCAVKKLKRMFTYLLLKPLLLSSRCCSDVFSIDISYSVSLVKTKLAKGTAMSFTSRSQI